MSFDTHKAYRTLIAGGFTESQADTIIGVVKDSGDEQITKGDLTVEMTKLRSEMSKLRSELVVWMFVFMAGQLGALVAIIKTMKGG